MTLGRVFEVITTTCFSERPKAMPAPDLPKGTYVRVPNKVRGEFPTHDRTRTLTEPFKGADGRWYVAVILYGQGTIMFPVDKLEPLEG